MNSFIVVPKALGVLFTFFLSNVLISNYGYEYFNIFFYIASCMALISLLMMVISFDETPLRKEEPSDDEYFKVNDEDVKTTSKVDSKVSQ